MSDIINRLRDRSFSSKAKDELCEEAAAEIERLLWRHKVSESIASRLAAEVVRLRDMLPAEQRIKELL